MKNMIRVLAIIASLVLTVGILTGCSLQGLREKAEAAQPEENLVTVVLYFSNTDATEMVREERTVPAGQAMELVALNELVKGSQLAGNMRTLPKEAKILSVKVEGGTAYVDFSQSTVDNHGGGSTGDRIAIDSVVYTLTELPGIEKVQILLEGQIVEAIFGHVATDKPIGR